MGRDTGQDTGRDMGQGTGCDTGRDKGTGHDKRLNRTELFTYDYGNLKRHPWTTPYLSKFDVKIFSMSDLII